MAVSSTTVEYNLTLTDNTGPAINSSRRNANALTAMLTQLGQNGATAFNRMQMSIIAFNQALDLSNRLMSMAVRAYDTLFKSSIELEKGVAGISTLFESTAQSSSALSQQIIYLQKRFGSDQKDLINAYYEAIASGAVSASDAMAFLIDAEKLSIGGMTSMQVAVDGLTSILAAYGLQVSEAKRVNDALFIGAAQGKTNITELVSSLGQASAMAKATGVSFQEYIAAVSAITTGGVGTAEAVTQVRSAMMGLSNQTVELQDVLFKLGIGSIQTEVTQNGLVNTLKKVISKTDGTTESLTKLFGRIEAVNAVLALTGNTVGKKYTEIMDDMAKKSDVAGQVTEKAFAKMANTIDFKLGLIKARLATLWTTENINKIFMPVIDNFNKLLDVIERTYNALSNIDFSKLISNFNTLAISIGAVALAFKMWAIYLSAGSILTAVEYVVLMGGVMAKQAITIAAVAAHWALIAVSITAVVFAIDILIRNLDKLDKIWSIIIDGLITSFLGLKLIFLEFMRVIAEGLERLFRPVKNSILGSTLPDFKADLDSITAAIDEVNAEIDLTSSSIKDAVSGIDTGILGQVFKEGTKWVDNFNKSLDKIPAKAKIAGDLKLPTPPEQAKQPQFQIPPLVSTESLKLVSQVFGSFVGDMVAGMSGVMSMAVMGIAGAANVILDAFKAIIEFIPSVINKIADIFNMLTDMPFKILDAFKNLGKSIGRFISDFIPGLIDALSEMFSYFFDEFPNIIFDAFQKLFDKLPSMIVKLVTLFFNIFATMLPRIINIIWKFIMKNLGPMIKAIIDGILVAVGTIITNIVNVFKVAINDVAKFFKLAPPFKFDTKDVEQKVKKLAADISRSASDVFSVIDLERAGKGMDLANKIRDAIDSGARRAGNVFQKWWNELVNIWRQVFDGFKKVWMDIWDSWIGPLFNGLRDIWIWVFDGFTKVLTAISGVFQWVFDKIFTPIIDAFKSVFQWISDNIIKPMVNAFQSFGKIITDAWQGVINYFDNFGEKITAAWQGIKDFFSTFGTVINTAWQGVIGFFNSFGTLINSAWKYITDYFNSFGILISAAWKAIIDFFNSLGIKIDAAWQGVKNYFSKFSEVITAAWGVVVSYWNTFWKIINYAWKAIVDYFADFGTIISKGWKGITDFFNSFGTVITNAFAGVFDWLNKFSFKMPSWLGGELGGFVMGKNTVAGQIADTWSRSDVGRGVTTVTTGISNVAGRAGIHCNAGGIVPQGQMINGSLYAAGGALARGTDTVPAMLTPGEFVVNRDAARYNLGLLSFINKVRSPVSPLAATSNISVIINAKTDLSADQIRREVIPTLEKELRKKSQEGKFVMATSGLRTNK